MKARLRFFRCSTSAAMMFSIDSCRLMMSGGPVKALTRIVATTVPALSLEGTISAEILANKVVRKHEYQRKSLHQGGHELEGRLVRCCSYSRRHESTSWWLLTPKKRLYEFAGHSQTFLPDIQYMIPSPPWKIQRLSRRL